MGAASKHLIALGVVELDCSKGQGATNLVAAAFLWIKGQQCQGYSCSGNSRLQSRLLKSKLLAVKLHGQTVVIHTDFTTRAQVSHIQVRGDSSAKQTARSNSQGTTEVNYDPVSVFHTKSEAACQCVPIEATVPP